MECSKNKALIKFSLYVSMERVIDMNNLTFESISNAEFRYYKGNPVLKYTLPSMVVADPSILTPDKTPDNKWHLFAHTFFGVYHYVSEDGISFSKEKRVAQRAMRPDIKSVDGEYYLYFERTRAPILNALNSLGVKWKSEIYMCKSTDLENWTEPQRVIGHTRDYEACKTGVAISNPFLIETEGKYRLYYSCGQTFIKDCGFSEPTHITFAESRFPHRDFVSREKPIISPDKNNKYLNLCSGCIKVYKLKDCYIGLQNGIFEENGKSYSAIMLLKSDDGENFTFVKPLIEPDKKYTWMAQFVYACCMTVYDGKIRIYFNARNVANMVKGRESIGFVEAEL